MRQFVAFLLAGGLAAVLNWGSRFLFSRWMPFEVAVTLAFLVGLGTGFVTMRWLVFSASHQSVGQQAGRYVLVNFFALLQTLFVSVVLARYVLPGAGVTNHLEAIAHLGGVLVPVATSFAAHKWYTFR